MQVSENLIIGVAVAVFLFFAIKKAVNYIWPPKYEYLISYYFDSELMSGYGDFTLKIDVEISNRKIISHIRGCIVKIIERERNIDNAEVTILNIIELDDENEE